MRLPGRPYIHGLINHQMSPYRSLAALVLLTLAGTAGAQTTRINGYGGYTFADKMNFDGYPGYDQARINESGHFGGGLEFEVRPNKSIEIYYQTQSTTGSLLGTLQEFETDVKVEYLMAGGMGYAGAEKVKGFGGLLLGAAFVSSEDVNVTKFGIGGRLGVLVSANDKIGIRLGAQVLSVVQGAGGGFYFGTGGAGAGVSTYSSIYQFGLFGGIAISVGSGGGGGRSARSNPPPPPPPAQTMPAPGVPPPPPPPPPR